MLPNAILINVGHSLYSSEYMSVCEERGLPIPKSEAEVPPLADPTVHIALVSRMLGRCEEGWRRGGFIGSLDANLGIAECTSDNGIQNFLWALLMACAGHGVSIADVSGWIERLDAHYGRDFDQNGKDFDTSPCDLEFTEYRELAEENAPGLHPCAACGGMTDREGPECYTCAGDID